MIHAAVKRQAGNVDAAIMAAQIGASSQKDASQAEELAALARARLTGDPAQVEAALTALYGDAWLVGAVAGVAGSGEGAAPTATVAAALSDLDWSTWEPGNAAAAEQVTSGGLSDLWANAGIVAKGITDTTLDRIGNAIGNTIAVGGTFHEASAAIDAILNDQSRADMIAVTETNRAFCAASVEQYQGNGASGFDVLPVDEPCDECQDEADANPHAFGDDPPPYHPSCRCGVAAVLPGGSGE